MGLELSGKLKEKKKRVKEKEKTKERKLPANQVYLMGRPYI